MTRIKMIRKIEDGNEWNPVAAKFVVEEVSAQEATLIRRKVAMRPHLALVGIHHWLTGKRTLGLPIINRQFCPRRQRDI